MSSTFAQLGVPADLVNLLAKQGINSPFPIQAATLPDALAGRDICGKAPTGSGKTLAFALAMALKLDQKAKPRAPRGLVLVPTRELAAQVQKELAPLARTRGRTVAAVYGGTGYEPQRRALRQGVDILVACPGRLEDLIARRDVSLDEVDLVVLDEADRMADMGFLPAVRRILDATRADRQTLLFSATLDGDVDKVVRRYQSDPRRHEVVAPESQAADVEHLFWHADRTARVRLTAELLRDHSSAIVFCRTKHGADRLVTQLSTAGVDAVAIHGNRSQGQRERALAAFSSGRVRALIATDVVARGIHVDDVPCIVHFDPPGDIKDYVHRSGRTGRAGATGTVVSLVAEDQVRSTRVLQRSLGLPERIDRPVGSRTPVPAGVGGGGAPSTARPARPSGPSGRERVAGPARGRTSGYRDGNRTGDGKSGRNGNRSESSRGRARRP